MQSILFPDQREHGIHHMQFTSLLNHFPPSGKEEFNQEFRRTTKGDVIRLLRQMGNLTDREMAKHLGYPDPNKVRPRRHELMKMKIVEEEIKRPCMVSGKLSIAWKLNPERLTAYVEVA